MKKIYLKPETSCMVTNTEWALCSQGGTVQQNGGNDPAVTNPGNDPWNPAPKRKVF